MHDFAIVALLGLATYKVTDFVSGIARLEDKTLRLFLTLAVGVLATEILDYSVFAGWHIAVRNSWMGPVFSGLICGAMAYAWDGALAYLAGLRRGSADSEHRSPRAA